MVPQDCLLGSPATRARVNTGRLELLATVTDELCGQEWDLGWGRRDAVLLPGGFLYVDQPDAALQGTERTVALSESSLGPACLDAAARLEMGCAGALLVTSLREPARRCPAARRSPGDVG